jgi:hypothetical protein
MNFKPGFHPLAIFLCIWIYSHKNKPVFKSREQNKVCEDILSSERKVHCYFSQQPNDSSLSNLVFSICQNEDVLNAMLERKKW